MSSKRLFRTNRKNSRDVIAVILYCIAVLALVAADQLTKYWAVNSLAEQGSVPVIGDFLRFTYIENTGASFSMLAGKRTLLIVFPAVVLTAVLVVIISHRIKSVKWNISLVLILAGGIGNLIDRIRLGYVVDFIDLHTIHFAIFNVADTFITIGVALLIILFLWQEGVFKRRKTKSGIFTRKKF
ncbi:signal peptidase II [[Clostridium] cellulosi]